MQEAFTAVEFADRCARTSFQRAEMSVITARMQSVSAESARAPVRAPTSSSNLNLRILGEDRIIRDFEVCAVCRHVELAQRPGPPRRRLLSSRLVLSVLVPYHNLSVHLTTSVFRFHRLRRRTWQRPPCAPAPQHVILQIIRLDRAAIRPNATGQDRHAFVVYEELSHTYTAPGS